MPSALIPSGRGYPAVRLAAQPAHRRSVRPGPLVLRTEPLKPPTPATDRDRTVSRRSEPSSRASHELQHNRLPCPSPSPRACSNSCPLSRDAIQPSYPLFSPLLLPLIFPSIMVFSTESVLHITWPKYWSFSFSISPSNEHSRLISFSMD